MGILRRWMSMPTSGELRDAQLGEIERLRRRDALCDSLADEIERLRAENNQLRRLCGESEINYAPVETD